MNPEKSNTEYLKEILRVVEAQNPAEAKEALEFIEAIENDLIEKNNRITELEKENAELEDAALDELKSYDNKSFVGLDTVKWSLEKGNLVIEQKMERFIESLQKQNCVVPV